jgi:hypothetical protein
MEFIYNVITVYQDGTGTVPPNSGAVPVPGYPLNTTLRSQYSSLSTMNYIISQSSTSTPGVIGQSGIAGSFVYLLSPANPGQILQFTIGSGAAGLPANQQTSSVSFSKLDRLVAKEVITKWTNFLYNDNPNKATAKPFKLRDSIGKVWPEFKMNSDSNSMLYYSFKSTGTFSFKMFANQTTSCVCWNKLIPINVDKQLGKKPLLNHKYVVIKFLIK